MYLFIELNIHYWLWRIFRQLYSASAFIQRVYPVLVPRGFEMARNKNFSGLRLISPLNIVSDIINVLNFFVLFCAMALHHIFKVVAGSPSLGRERSHLGWVRIVQDLPPPHLFHPSLSYHDYDDFQICHPTPCIWYPRVMTHWIWSSH